MTESNGGIKRKSALVKTITSMDDRWIYPTSNTSIFTVVLRGV